MTTRHTPRRILIQQARLIAHNLKMAERGQEIPGDTDGKVAAARKTPSIKPAIVMDDAIITMEFKWDFIRSQTEDKLTKVILNAMRARRE